MIPQDTPHARELSCDEALPLLPMVADGAIEPAADTPLFEHLARCTDCQDHLARLDLVTLALEQGRSVAPSTPRALRFRLPLPFAAAAAGLAATVVWLGYAPEQPSAPAQPVTQVFQVPGSNAKHPVYVVVSGGQATVVDPAAADGATPGERPAQVQSVGNKLIQ